MVSGRPLFPGSNAADELKRIFKVLGTPDEKSWVGVAELPDWRTDFPKHRRLDISKLVPGLDAKGHQLLKVIYCYIESKLPSNMINLAANVTI